MKLLFKRILNGVTRSFVKSSAGWKISTYLLRLSGWLSFVKSNEEHLLSEKKLKEVFSNLTVNDGYFKGLKYPDFSTFGSSLFPKLAGTYESELIPVFKNLENTAIKTIIDIGCAEGYYAVGLAMKHPEAQVIAFDISDTARAMCSTMAKLNNVSDRITILKTCTPEWINTIDGSKTLIICDCEGFERDLFTKQNAVSLVNSELIIELHPMYNTDVREYLTVLFRDTHNIYFVSSYDDERKLFDLNAAYKELDELSKLKIIQEGRPFTMDWLIATPK